MAKALYTAEAHVTGGRANGHGRTGDGALEVDLRLPEQLGGQGGGTNPEQLFAVGYAACFEGALGTVARRSKQETGDVAVDSKVSLIPTEERGFTIAVELHVALPAIEDAAEAVELRARRPPGMPLLQRDARQHRRAADGDRERQQAARRVAPRRVVPPRTMPSWSSRRAAPSRRSSLVDLAAVRLQHVPAGAELLGALAVGVAESLSSS